MNIRDLCGIVLSDGGVVYDALDYSIQELKEIANASFDRSVIIVKNASRFDVHILETISNIADAKMIFDFTK